MKSLTYPALIFISCMAIFFAACTKEDAYKNYEKGGELTYPGRADSVFFHSGNLRAQLSIVLGNDPLVTKAKVYWNNRQDSTELPVKYFPGNDTVNLVIPNLKEGNYNFEIYTYDKLNHRSVVVNVGGFVYGSTYLGSLANRNLKSLSPAPDGSALELTWGTPAIGEIGIQLKYSDNSGAPKSFFVPLSQTTTTLANYKYGSTLMYRSLFKPDSASVDTFSSPYTSVTLPLFERQLNKSLFNVMVLPSDAQEGGYGWLMQYLWDDVYTPPGFATTSGVPQSFTFDTGVTSTLSRFKTWQPLDRIYDQQSVKSFEVWGSNNPNPDGSWASWTKLLSCQSVKPSGLPVGQNTPEDIAYAEAGEEFVFPAGTPKVRYLRFKLISNWGDSDFMAMEELTFWTHDH
ncbi:MAG: hypothetical protein M3O71_01925 [Bacteroidota bacterium]|nr:hypothetical protein [Bacteroidota bacterium]